MPSTRKPMASIPHKAGTTDLLPVGPQQLHFPSRDAYRFLIENLLFTLISITLNKVVSVYNNSNASRYTLALSSYVNLGELGQASVSLSLWGIKISIPHQAESCRFNIKFPNQINRQNGQKEGYVLNPPQTA
jgi:hypothetical protein